MTAVRTDQLRALLVIAETSSLRVAAARLGCSQSSLSASVQRLEAELGITLLERSRTGTTLRPAAVAALDPIRDICRAEDTLRQVLNSFAERGPELVRVAAVTSAVNTVLPDSLHDLLQDANIEVQVRIGGSDEVIEQLRENRADLGLTVCESGDGQFAHGLRSETLLSAPVGVAMPIGHRLAAADSVALEQLRGERMISFRSGYLMHQVARRLSSGTAARVVSLVESTPEAVRLVSAGVGMCFVPSFSIAAGEAVEWRALADADEHIDLVLVRPVRSRHSAPVSRLESRIRWHSERLRVTHNGGSAKTAVRETV